jgi:O-antigen/teichoic acid export membrane protein
MFSTLKQFSKNPLIKRIFAYGVSDSISKIAPFIILPIILKFLSPADYGYIANFIALINLFTPFVLVNGHTYYSVQFHKINNNKRANLFWNLIYVSIVMLLFTSIGSFIAKDIFIKYYDLDLKWVYLALLTAFFMALIMSFQTWQRMAEKVKDFAHIQIGNSILSALLAVTFVIILGLSWQGRVVALFLTSFITVIYSLYLLFKEKFLDFRFDRQAIKYFLLFALPLLPHSVAGWGKGAIEKGFVTSMVSIADNGILATASISMVMIGVITTAVFSAFNPEVLKLLAKIDVAEESQSEVLKLKVVKMSLLMLLFMTLVIIMSYPLNYLFFNFYLDKTYSSGLIYVPFLLIIAFFNLFYALFSLYIMNEKKSGILSVISITTISLELGFSYFAILRNGIIGLMMINIFFSIFRSLAIAYYAQKLRPMPWFYMLNNKSNAQ